MNRFAVVVAALFLSLSGSAQEEACRSVQWAHRLYLPEYQIREIASIDYDEDGKFDLVGVIGGNGSHWQLVWWKGEGDGTFRQRSLLLDAWPSSRQAFSNIVIADATGDGLSDIITVMRSFAVRSGYWSEQQELVILPATGYGLGPALMKKISDATVTSIAAIQRDADPAVEVILNVSDSRRLDVYDDIAATPRLTGSIQAEMTPTGIVGADFDGDSHLDVAVAMRRLEARGLYVYFGKADGTFETAVALPSIHPYYLVAGDLNEDGRPDFVASNYEIHAYSDRTPAAPVSVYLNQGGRGFLHSEISLSRLGPFDISDDLLLEDVSGDGHLDLLAAKSVGSMATMAGRGDGTFLTPTVQPSSSGGQLAAGDFDGDGKPDLARGTSIAANTCATHVALEILPSVPYSVTTYAYGIVAAISMDQEVALSVKISGFGSDLPLPMGTVTLLDGTAVLASSPAGANGEASFVVTGLALGKHYLAAVFEGNPAVPAAPSVVVEQMVVSEPTRIIVSLSGPTPVYGELLLGIRIDAIHSGDGGGWDIYDFDGVETTVSFYDWRPEPGSHTFIAKYSGTTTATPAQSAPFTFTVDKGNPVLELNSSLAVRETPEAVAFAVKGLGPIGPGGTVQLIEGTTTIGSGALVNGSAIINVALSRGVHDLRAVYSGDTRYREVSRNLRFEVLPNLPFPIDAQAMAGGIRIAYILPATAIANTLQLHRRAAGTTEWAVVPGWNPVTGMDASVPKRGVTYEYRLLVTFKNASRSYSSMDSAALAQPRRRAVSP